MSTGIPTYPVRVEGSLDPSLSRWLWLVKWLLVIPHYVVLAFLWAAFAVLSVLAFFAILATGRYPRAIFDFNVGVLRWTWRVAFYAFSANGTDRYPPFTLAETDYPATFRVEYPERLSRGLVLVKWWLLAIPHYVVLAFFVGGTMWLGFQSGLVFVLVLFGVVALLVTGRYPGTIFDFVLGMDRWALRVAAYAGLMTDRYPPFRLDLGGTESGAELADDQAVSASAGGWTGGRVTLAVVGSIAALIGLGLVAGGAATVVLDKTQRDDAGYLMSPTERFTTGTYAFVSETVDVRLDGPDWAYVDDLVGTVQLRSESAKPLFVGIAPADDVDSYLAGVTSEEVTDVGAGRNDHRLLPGTATPELPGTQRFWAATAVGAGEQTLLWDASDGTWRIVVMNADAEPGVDAKLSIGAELPNLGWISIGFLGGGALFLALGGVLIYLALRRRPV
jgi:hypothetical protein